MKVILSLAKITRFVRLSSVCSAAAVCIALVSGNAASAALIPNAITGVTGIGSAIGDGADPNNGSHSRVVNGAGLTVGDPLNSATWLHLSNWEDGWQHKLSTAGSFILDLGSIRSDLDKLYIWNVTENGSTNRGAQDIQVYFAATPTVTPVKNVVNDFNSGGWTSLATLTLSQGTSDNANNFDGLVDLEPVTTARYIGIRMINNYGGGDIGLAEAQVTAAAAVPEPATTALFSLGVVVSFVYARRRRNA